MFVIRQKNTSRPLCPILAGSPHPVRSAHGELVEPCPIWRLAQFRIAAALAPRLKRPQMAQNVSDGKNPCDGIHRRAFWPWAFPIPTRRRIVSQSPPMVGQSAHVVSQSRRKMSQSRRVVSQSPPRAGRSNPGPTGSCASSSALASFCWRLLTVGWGYSTIGNTRMRRGAGWPYRSFRGRAAARSRECRDN